MELQNSFQTNAFVNQHLPCFGTNFESGPNKVSLNRARCSYGGYKNDHTILNEGRTGYERALEGQTMRPVLLDYST